MAPQEEPLLFLKAPSSVILDGGDIVLPPESREVHYEGELALIIGLPIKNWAEEHWLDALAGVCCANDVTARDLQKKDGQWARAKSFDTFCPIGPCVITDLDPSDLAIDDARQRRREAVRAHLGDGLLSRRSSSRTSPG